MMILLDIWTAYLIMGLASRTDFIWLFTRKLNEALTWRDYVSDVLIPFYMFLLSL